MLQGSPAMQYRPVLGLSCWLAAASAQFEEEEKPYRGQLVGSLNSYHHQVLYVLSTLYLPSCPQS